MWAPKQNGPVVIPQATPRGQKPRSSQRGSFDGVVMSLFHIGREKGHLGRAEKCVPYVGDTR